jgi:putative endopeptidase
MAYATYRRYIARRSEAAALSGLTGDQRFFLGGAQAGRRKMREGRLRQVLLTDPHSPEVFRVNGVVRNVNDW